MSKQMVQEQSVSQLPRNTMGGAGKHRRSLWENRSEKDMYTQNQKQTKFFGHNEERMFREFYTHRTYRKQTIQGKTVGPLPDVIVSTGDWTWVGRLDKETNVDTIYKGNGIWGRVIIAHCLHYNQVIQMIISDIQL